MQDGPNSPGSMCKSMSRPTTDAYDLDQLDYNKPALGSSPPCTFHRRYGGSSRPTEAPRALRRAVVRRVNPTKGYVSLTRRRATWTRRTSAGMRPTCIVFAANCSSLLAIHGRSKLLP